MAFGFRKKKTEKDLLIEKHRLESQIRARGAKLRESSNLTRIEKQVASRRATLGKMKAKMQGPTFGSKAKKFSSNFSKGMGQVAKSFNKIGAAAERVSPKFNDAIMGPISPKKKRKDNLDNIFKI